VVGYPELALSEAHDAAERVQFFLQGRLENSTESNAQSRGPLGLLRSSVEANGMTAGLVGGSGAAFGYSGRSFGDWMAPGQRGDLTSFEFIGPNSPHPGSTLFPKDWNNFGPAVGFAWQVPWFGEGKTAVRGGYQVTYQTRTTLGAAAVPEPATTTWERNTGG
jgi:hypothetical protein